MNGLDGPHVNLQSTAPIKMITSVRELPLRRYNNFLVEQSSGCLTWKSKDVDRSWSLAQESRRSGGKFKPRMTNRALHSEVIALSKSNRPSELSPLHTHRAKLHHISQAVHTTHYVKTHPDSKVASHSTVTTFHPRPVRLNTTACNTQDSIQPRTCVAWELSTW